MAITSCHICSPERARLNEPLESVERKYREATGDRGDTSPGNGEKVHFGDIMELCHEQHSGLPEERQGTSASHMVAIARSSGNDRADCDAVGAYHQVMFADIMQMANHSITHIETWVSLPKHCSAEIFGRH